MCRGARDGRHVRTAGHRPMADGGDFDDLSDVLLGTVKAPLVKLLTQRTGAL